MEYSYKFLSILSTSSIIYVISRYDFNHGVPPPLLQAIFFLLLYTPSNFKILYQIL